MNRILFCLSIILMMAYTIGCSGGVAPVNPPENNNTGLTAMTDNQPVASESDKGHALLGYWSCTFDPETKTIEFVPMRTTELHLNVVPYLEFGTMNVSLVPPVQVIDGVLYAKVKLTHPFSGKKQLSGFDVKGILITSGTKGGFSDPDIRIAGPKETRLVNADGFTRWWNPSEFLLGGTMGYTPGKLGTVSVFTNGAILNGYKLYADGLGADGGMNDVNQANRALFTAGASNVRKFAISLASGLKFNYAVDACWAKPNPNPPVNLPGDFPIEANQPEPWWIEVNETLNTLWYEAGEYGGNVAYEIKVHDWQGINDLGALKIEAPGVFSDSVSTYETVDANTVKCSFSFIMPVLTSADPLDVLISVSVPGDYQPGLTGVNKPLKAYHRHISQVLNKKPTFNQAPVALMHATSPTDIYKDDTVSFDATASYDPDGFINQYLWDFNGNGIYGEEPYTGDPKTPTYQYKTTGNFSVTLKVRDNEGKSTISSPVIVNVTLDINDPPVAIAKATSSTNINEDETVSFDGSESYDLDGTVVDWQWDFNGDGVYGDPFSGDMKTPTATFPNPGTYYVDLKVIDDGGATDTLDAGKKIKVTVTNVLINPVAKAKAVTPTEIDACGKVTFDASDSSDADGTIDKYLWDFNGDGTFGDPYDSGTDINPTKIFYAGVYNVQLKVIDNEALEDILDSPIIVTATNVSPIADAKATTPTNIYGGMSVTFDASGSTDPDCNDIVSYEWDFDGDGKFGDAYNSGTDIKPTKIYNPKGSFNVWLRVTDGEGATDITDSPIVVNVTNNPPVACAVIESSQPYFWKTDINFSGECSDDVDGTIVSWEWDLGADGSYEKTGKTTSYYFTNAGWYTLQLKVTDNEGDWDLLDTPLSFYVNDDSNMPPEITAVNRSRTTSQRNNPNEKVSLSVEFTDLMPPGDVHTYLWTCPYGSFDDPTSPTPVWTPPNQVVKCQITVRVTDAGGMWDEASCNQWVTQWPVLNNSLNPMTDKSMIPPANLDTIYDVFINPASFKYPDTKPDGKVIFINFWAVGCGYCKLQMPYNQELYDAYKDLDYVHLYINPWNESKAYQKSWIESNPYKATYWALDTGAAYINIFKGWVGGSTGIPQTYVFDRDGRCRRAKLGCAAPPYGQGAAEFSPYINEFI